MEIIMNSEPTEAKSFLKGLRGKVTLSAIAGTIILALISYIAKEYIFPSVIGNIPKQPCAKHEDVIWVTNEKSSIYRKATAQRECRFNIALSFGCQRKGDGYKFQCPTTEIRKKVNRMQISLKQSSIQKPEASIFCCKIIKGK